MNFYFFLLLVAVRELVCTKPHETIHAVKLFTWTADRFRNKQHGSEPRCRLDGAHMNRQLQEG